MRRALGAALCAALITTVCTVALSTPASAATVAGVSADPIAACTTVASAVSTDIDPGGWDFSGSDADGHHEYAADGLHISVAAGGTSMGELVLEAALPLAQIGAPALMATTSVGDGPTLGLEVEVDGDPAGTLESTDGDHWWSDSALPGVTGTDHAADGTLDDILAGVTGAGSVITVSAVDYLLTSSAAASATITSITAGCVQYTFQAVTVAASIVGNVVVGGSVSVDTTGWTPTPASLSYEWSVAGSVVSNESTYSPQAADLGRGLSVTVTGDGPGYAGVATTVGPILVDYGTFTTAAPTISGTRAVGATLTALVTGWSPAPTEVDYQWYRNGAGISGATGQTYVPVAADKGASVSVTVTGSRDGYTSAPRTSSAVIIGAGTLSAPTPAISGTIRAGSTVLVVAGTWSPAATLGYQWRIDGAAIAGATGTKYLIPAAYAGRKLSVTVTGTLAGYATRSVTSTATTIPAATFTAATPTISGTVRVGSVVKVVLGAWSPAATTLKYQWRANGVAIPGATGSSYTVAATFLGRHLSVVVTGSRPGYTTAVRTSAAPTITAGVFTPASPKITGITQVGSKVSVNRGTWTPSATAFTYQWRANGATIKGATGTSYTIKAADRGKRLSVTVTGSRAGYTTRAVSSAAALVTTAFTRTTGPTITGTLRVGSVLTAHVSAWTPSASVSYQWKRDGVAIAGATKVTYKLVVADHGHRITVMVTGRRSGYTTSTRTSAATGAVAWPVGISTVKITKQPASSRPTTGAVGTMTVTATGGGLHYQWQYSADDTSWSKISGQTSATLSIRMSSARTGFYRVYVSNVTGGKYSSIAVFMVSSSRADPYAPGKVFVLNDWGAEIGKSVRGYDPYGTSVVAAPVFASYAGSGSAYPWLDLDIEYIGSNGVVYDDSDVYPFDDDIWSTDELFSGAYTTFVAYAAVPPSAIPGGVWRITDYSDWSNVTVQFVKGYAP